MLMIRVFLWGLVAAMTLQGWLHADDYGAAAGLLGGMSLTLSVWRESTVEGVRSLFWRSATYVGLPRALVQVAVRETSRHPSIHTVPALRRVLDGHERSWSAFRDAEITWMLAHADLVGALLAEPTATAIWHVWEDRVNATANEIVRLKRIQCMLGTGARCMESARMLAAAEKRLGEEARAQRAWNRVLQLSGATEPATWWQMTQNTTRDSRIFERWATGLAQLHNITAPTDRRVATLRTSASAIAMTLTAEPWTLRLMESLLVGELLGACLAHVVAREGRIREMMAATGIADLILAQDRALNASLRVASSDVERRTVQEWFGEMASYAWWPGDDVPSVVRRCLATSAGECVRVGPTEIASLSAQMDERVRIAGDWARRLFIGMWNALPAVALLFLLEILTLCVEKRRPRIQQQQQQQPIVLRLEMPRPDGGIVTRDLPLVAQ
jgi:hypothetical protein